MACALPWVKDQHIPNIFQHCPGMWGDREVTRNVARKYIKKYDLYIYQDQMF